MASKKQIMEWLNRAEILGASHMLVKSDDFSHEYYPVFVGTGRSHDRDSVFDEIAHTREQDLTSVKEVYDMSLDKQDQINQNRTWNT